MRGTPAILLLVAACGAGVTSVPVRGPDGEGNWVAITCKGAQLRCVQRAGEVCPRGYDVFGERGHDGQETRAAWSGGAGGLQSTSTYDGELLVKCHGPATEVDSRRFRECMGNEGCDTGDRCAFAEGASRGRCTADKR